jgi:hypothetical protein
VYFSQNYLEDINRSIRKTTSPFLTTKIRKNLDFNCGLKVPKRPLKSRQRPFIIICYDFVDRLGWSAHEAKMPNQHALFVSKSKLSKSKQTLPFCCGTRYSSGLCQDVDGTKMIGQHGIFACGSQRS